MSSLEELIAKAKTLQAKGHSPSQIADELSLSMETITWLLTQKKGAEVPKDIHIDWSAVSSHADMLQGIAAMMFTRWYHACRALPGGVDEPELPTVVIGVAQSGIPLATLIAAEMDLKFTMYYPKKHALGDKPVGSVSDNFSKVSGERCLIVDDVITSGNTMREIVDFLHTHGAHPVGISVIFDKRNLRDVDGVPVCALFKVSRID
ncbi:MAG: orotate phosphoribosyltransferase-like protein [Methanomicrobiaceae archaeon]|nr:orotate phosphoribosyltransferase-like protein [Methanomicrobiaceae archaeon]